MSFGGMIPRETVFAGLTVSAEGANGVVEVEDPLGAVSEETSEAVRVWLV